MDETARALTTVLAKRGDTRLEALLDSANPQAVMAAMAPAEAFFTYAQLEEEGRRSLLKLITDDQLLYLLDLDLWQKDTLVEEKFLEWLERLASVSNDHIAAWLLSTEKELVVSLLKLLCTVMEGPSSSDESLTEEADRLPPFTAEGVYYILFHSERAATALKAPFLLMAASNLEQYFALMQSVVSSIPSVIMEKAYAQRWKRLRDEGFLPPDEAYELYRWPESTVAHEETPAAVHLVEERYTPTALSLAEPQGILASSLVMLEETSRKNLSQSIAITSTHVLAADHLSFSDLSHYRLALEKTLGYISIGLQDLSGGDQKMAIELLEKFSAKGLFRHGYAKVAGLGRKATMLRRQGWLSQIRLGIEVLDEPLSDVITALARPRPLYPAQSLDGESDDREFRHLGEVERCAELLREAMALKSLFIDALGLDLVPAETFDLNGCTPAEPSELTLGLILRTALAQWLLTGKLHFAPIEAENLAELIRRVRHISDAAYQAEVKGPLLKRLESATTSENQQVERILEQNLALLTTTLAGIDLNQQVDPRFVGAIVIKDV